ncbi:MAG: transglycosylase SLT domain-containing protein [Thermoanaerobaculia bacterium]|nr:transglycosylase SLT domain-containing protein [Thermoanaerobaculia bacterium]
MPFAPITTVVETRKRRRWLIFAIVFVIVAALAGAGAWFYSRESKLMLVEAPAKPAAPPDLEKLRPAFVAGLAAVERGDGDEAVKQLASFNFGPRAVEEYRLYYLGNAQQMQGRRDAARSTLARLWRGEPQLVYAADSAFTLADLHYSAGDWSGAATIYRRIARMTATPAIAGTARWQEVETSLAAGDLPGAIRAARLIAIHSPRSPHAAGALTLLRAVSAVADEQPLDFSHAERFERAVSLQRDRDVRNALAELTALAPAAPTHLELPIQLQRGIALHQLRRFEESNRMLEPLTSGYFKYAVPALLHLSRNYRLLSASIDATVTKTIVEKKRVGTVKVRVGQGKSRRLVNRPKMANVKRSVKLVDLVKKAKKDEYERLASVRLRDILQLPLDRGVHLEVLNTLIVAAQTKNQDDYVRELVTQVVKIDAQADPALQYLWDKAWGAYTSGDLASARPEFRYIADTYASPNVRRQSEYWLARTVERAGEKEEAAAIYRKLAAAPYADIYAIHAVSRGAKREENRDNPLNKKETDWREIAEKQMPKELRLAYELTALSDYRNARLEIQANIRPENARFGDAILADIYHSIGNPVLMYLSIRRAWPQLATAEQDSVPAYFLKMYYPVKYDEPIRKYSERHGVDPNLVRGLILQESYFDPRAKSRVGATGLMQIMPPTGKELARKLRVPFGESRLDNPEVNVQLGTRHLRGLIDMFGGSAYLAVASYNAGQGNVLKWRRAAKTKPLDEFLESIPFPETRNYVKRVTMLRSAYSRIAQ